MIFEGKEDTSVSMERCASVDALLEYISESPTAFHAVEATAARLQARGFSALPEGADWMLEPGKGYYMTRNQSTVLAFRMPKGTPQHVMIAASHSDSPMFKLKPNCESVSANSYVRLNTEVYGGTILSSWLDRPLSVAGRVILAKDGVFSAKTVKIDRDLLMIPNVAIHFNRTVNSGYSYNPAVDMLPLFAEKGEAETTVKALVAEELGCSVEEIRSMDLFAFCRMPGSVWGAQGEFFSSPRIDNLMCAYGTLQGFLDAAPSDDVLTVFYCADNEETGSATKQGAGSVLLSDMLDRICEKTGADKRRILASSMMLSADNGHAIHPNHPEMSDAQNAPRMNRGVVIKSNAAQKYTTEAVSMALFTEICRHADVPVQYYSNRSDMPGGSTLGSISNTQVPLVTVDIGLAQLAMHSAYETAGCRDVDHLINASRAFFESTLSVEADGTYRLNFN